jgi:SAM-dependent methyltransferase
MGVDDSASAETADEVARIRRYFGSAAWRRWSSGREYLLAERQRLLADAAKLAVLGEGELLSVLDVGCGTGNDLALWRSLGVPEENLAGTELLRDRAAEASARLPSAEIVLTEGFALPFADGRFHLTTASLVLSTIVDPGLRKLLFSEMIRVTAPLGVVAVYDFRVRKPTNRAVIAITRTRAARMGRDPDQVKPAAPFLPALPAFLRLPRPLRGRLMSLLPRTHAMYLWRR